MDGARIHLLTAEQLAALLAVAPAPANDDVDELLVARAARILRRAGR